MFFSDTVKLRAVVKSVDSDGYETVSVTETVAFADVKTATRAEFYAANANDINITIVFGIHTEDFANQTEVEYNSKIYDVVRSYAKGLGIIELNCSDRKV